ncbi:hypothetical protein ACSW95_16400 (plasmid) [Clostridium perfringens]|uniref:hypothetical protein n=1 Tax=Clostridium perfringens TaxID=1502 RepID=UPI001ABAB12F|nr:hypothetical protein [Clostridium perfringens]EIF2088136.1 hypothetical protein [Clostridium perfringens]EIF2808633.1 hypothetical protein [Clostridium perfringens]ELC8311479.1 hypothetical protein [Clostridium perfringens]ELC8354935.1 hypothetical protein [Clostridium perfringens]ELC8411459.1 hypothetical protein [Clostridium perfringens]
MNKLNIGFNNGEEISIFINLENSSYKDIFSSLFNGENVSVTLNEKEIKEYKVSNIVKVEII